MIITVILFTSVCVALGYWVSLRQAIAELPRIDAPDSQAHGGFSDHSSSLSVIIPAYNEAENIEECVSSVLLHTALPPHRLEVWVVDDQSIDRTWAILQALQQKFADPRLHLIAGAPRPEDKHWVGKNWACQQAAEQAKGDFLLFIDADVRLKPGAIATILRTATEQQLDFITCIPQIVSASLPEWLVQPFMYINVLVSFNSAAVKNPKTPTAYALGPFLLFRSTVYHQLGTHDAIATEVAEDVAFARKIKRHGYRARSILAPNLVSVRLYRTWSALWEGWTKVVYIGAQQNVPVMGLLIFVMLLLYTVPWFGLAWAIRHLIMAPTAWVGLQLGVAGVALGLQYDIRKQGSQALGTFAKYWWLQWLSGLIISAIAIASVIKTETGWGWTWRGRPLKSTHPTTHP